MRPIGEVISDVSKNITISTEESDYLRAQLNLIEQNMAMTQGWVSANPTQISNASVLAGSGNSLLDDQGLRIYDGPTLTGWWQIDGTLRTGSNLAAANTTSFAVFPNLTTYNGESMPIGTVLMGSNSSGYSNIRYDPSTGQLEFRGGTTVQAYVGTDGVIYAGGGALTLGTAGITVFLSSAIGLTRSYKFLHDSSDNQYMGLYGSEFNTGGVHYYWLGITANDTASDGIDRYINMQTLTTGAANNSIEIQAMIASGNQFELKMVPTGIKIGMVASIDTMQLINEFSTDTTCAGNSNTAVPTEAVLVAYTAAQIAAIPPSGGGGCIARGLLGI